METIIKIPLYSRIRPDFDIFGIDIAPNMIELARNRYNPTAMISADYGQAGKIDKIETKYDGIFADIVHNL